MATYEKCPHCGKMIRMAIKYGIVVTVAVFIARTVTENLSIVHHVRVQIWSLLVI